MNKKLNEILAKKIANNIHGNKKPIEYLSSILNIGRESAYRRMRGEIPFTFEEIAKLSLSLNFSIDEIVGRNNENYAVFLDIHQKALLDYEKYFYIAHLKYYNDIELISKGEKTDILISVNCLNSFLMVKFDLLFKFCYYKWMHKCSSAFQHYTFSETEIPSQIIQLQQQINSKIYLVKNVSFIFDQNIFVRFIREIQYYYNRKLISDEEIQGIRSEITCFLDYIEKLIHTGTDKLGSEYNFYLSLLDVDLNSMCGTFDGNIISRYMDKLYMINNLNPEMSVIHKNWINSLKRSSVLISHSNEMVQASFFDTQREYIGKITNDLFFYYE